MKKFKSLLWIVVFIAAAVYAAGWLKQAEVKKSGRKDSGAARAIIVKTIKASTDTVENIIEINGRLQPPVESIISAETEGILENTYKEMGDFVESGDVLAEADSSEYLVRKIQAEADYMQILNKLSLDTLPVDITSINIENISILKKARANYDNLRSSSWRITELGKNQLASKQMQEDTSSKLKAAEADLQAALEEAKNLVIALKSKKAAAEFAAKKLSDTKIIAPYSGYILKRHASKGEYVKVGTPLYSMVKSDPVKFSGFVSEAYMKNIHAGKEIEITVEALDYKVKSRISRISPSASADNHSVEIEADIPNPDNKLKTGFFANARIILYKKEDAVVLTNEALYTFAGINKVFIIENSKSFERKIKIGRRFADRFEAAEGLKGGEIIAVSNVTKLYDNAPVIINPDGEENGKSDKNAFGGSGETGVKDTDASGKAGI